MYVLVLNHIRAQSKGLKTNVCHAETSEELLGFLEAEKVEDYTDGEWTKAYRKGGKLEWFNPPADSLEGIKSLGTIEEFLEKATDQYYDFLEDIPTIEMLKAL